MSQDSWIHTLISWLGGRTDAKPTKVQGGVTSAEDQYVIETLGGGHTTVRWLGEDIDKRAIRPVAWRTKHADKMESVGAMAQLVADWAARPAEEAAFWPVLWVKRVPAVTGKLQVPMFTMVWDGWGGVDSSGWERITTVFVPELSGLLKEWCGKAGEQMEQSAFAALMERFSPFIATKDDKGAAAAALMGFARQFVGKRDVRVESGIDINTGSIEFGWKEGVSGTVAKASVPAKFRVVLPLLEFDQVNAANFYKVGTGSMAVSAAAGIEIPCRFRYRVHEAGVKCWVDIDDTACHGYSLGVQCYAEVLRACYPIAEAAKAAGIPIRDGGTA